MSSKAKPKQSRHSVSVERLNKKLFGSEHPIQAAKERREEERERVVREGFHHPLRNPPGPPPTEVRAVKP